MSGGNGTPPRTDSPPEDDRRRPNWKGALRGKQVRGSVQLRYKNWIRDLYRKKGAGTPFTLKQMMRDCGTDILFQSDYSTAHTFMMKMRKDFADVMISFFSDKEYDEAKAAGLSDAEMFRKLVEAALSYDVYPVYSDPNDEHRYKLFDMVSFVELMGLRARAIVKEVERKGEQLELAFSKIPELRGLYARPQLTGDGVVMALPPGIECDQCGKHFSDQPTFVVHYGDSHSHADPNGPSPPVLGPGSPPSDPTVDGHECPLCHERLLLKESGEYKCPVCDQRYTGDGKPIHTRSATHSVGG